MAGIHVRIRVPIRIRAPPFISLRNGPAGVLAIGQLKTHAHQVGALSLDARLFLGPAVADQGLQVEPPADNGLSIHQPQTELAQLDGRFGHATDEGLIGQAPLPAKALIQHCGAAPVKAQRGV